MGDQVAELLALAERVEGPGGYDNSLDVLVEIAMFKPNRVYSQVRSNAAGTKVIYTDHAGHDVTCWSEDWTCWYHRQSTAAALRARVQMIASEIVK